MTAAELAAVFSLALVCGAQTYLFLCIVCVMRAARRLPSAIAVAIGASAWLLPTLAAFNHRMPNANTVSNAIVLAIVTVFVFVTVRTLHRLYETHAQLLASSQQLEEAAVQSERRRIAYDLHDALGHELTTLNVTLENAVAICREDPERAAGFVAAAKDMASTALATVRTSVGSLADNPLQGEPLDAVIARLCEEVARRTAIDVRYNGTPAACAPRAAVALYRVLQEALTNVIRHANARRVEVQLDADRRYVTLEVRDDGMGFSPAGNRTGLGLRTMLERVQSVGGNLEFVTAPNAGCTIRATVPAAPL